MDVSNSAIISWCDRVKGWNELLPLLLLEKPHEIEELAEFLKSLSENLKHHSTGMAPDSNIVELLELISDSAPIMADERCSSSLISCTLALMDSRTRTMSAATATADRALLASRATMFLSRLMTRFAKGVDDSPQLAGMLSFWGFTQYDLHLAVIRQCCEHIASQLTKTPLLPSYSGGRIVPAVPIVCCSCLEIHSHIVQLVAVCRICLRLNQKLDVADALAAILSHLFIHHSSEELVENFYAEIATTYLHRYTGESSLLPYSCLLSVWKCKLSAIETEILDLVKWTCQTPVTSSDLLLIRSQFIVTACSENPDIMTAVFAILQSIYVQSNGHSGVGWIIGQLSRALLRCTPLSIIDSPHCCLLLARLLQVAPSSLSRDSCLHRIGLISNALGAAVTGGAQHTDISWLLVQSSDWSQVALALCYQGDKKLVLHCVNILSWFHTIHVESSQHSQLTTLTINLKLLMHKSSLSVSDVWCIVADCLLLQPADSAALKVCDERAKLLSRKLLVTFCLQSLGGASVIESVLTQVCGLSNKRLILEFLLEILRVIVDVPTDWICEIFRSNRATVRHLMLVGDSADTVPNAPTSADQRHTTLISDYQKIVGILAT